MEYALRIGGLGPNRLGELAPAACFLVYWIPNTFKYKLTIYQLVTCQPGLVFCRPGERREVVAGLVISFSLWQCAGHGDVVGPGFVH